MNTNKIIIANILLFFVSSCMESKFQDFDFLIEKTDSNKEEVAQIIANYRNSASKEEREAYEYILDHIEDQYYINFKLEKGGDTILLDDKIRIDSIISLQNKGFSINLQDTVHDLDQISSEDLHRHVQQFVK